MTLGGNSIIKTVFHKQEVALVRDWVARFKKELREVSELKDDLTMNPKWIELRAKIDFGERLLGRR